MQELYRKGLRIGSLIIKGPHNPITIYVVLWKTVFNVATMVAGIIRICVKKMASFG
jgi:hypothetical protein